MTKTEKKNMKASLTRILNTTERKIYYGMKIRTGKKTFYGAEDGKPILHEDRKVITKRVRQFNAQSKTI